MTRRRNEGAIDLSAPIGRPITTGQLARALGYSVQTIRRELEAGELHGYRTGRYREWRIEWAEARAYCQRIGHLRV